MTIDERIEALTMSLDRRSRESEGQKAKIEALLSAVHIDAENIRALARIAETREHRIARPEGGGSED